ncbi:MAG TPA: hypothetical protein VHJ34_12495 [Actinomycetota bacterium]|nr:hypothetical protein [Actinomycetota bacterium]
MRLDRHGRLLRATALALALVAGACNGGSGGDARPGASRGSSPPGASPAPQSPGAPEIAATPLPGRDLRRGGGTWAVYFAVSEFGDPEVERVAARLQAQGHEPSTLSLECDRGAADALGVPEQSAAVALYFGSESEARAFADAVEPAPDGVARVETRCID